jgi:glutaredoxin-like protein NrdH
MSLHVNDGLIIVKFQLVLNQALIVTISEDKMQIVKVPGRNKKHKILVYALSTCGWCKRAKQFLKDNNVEYEYIDVDLCNLEDKQKIFKEIQSRGGILAYPTLIIDNKTLFTGAPQDKLKEALEI